MSRRALIALAVAASLAALLALRVAADDPTVPVLLLAVVPIAVAARWLGLRAGLATAAVAFALVLLWAALEPVALSAGHLGVRAVVFVAAALAAARPAAHRLARRDDALAPADDEVAHLMREIRGQVDELGAAVDTLAASDRDPPAASVRQFAFVVAARVVGLQVLLERLERRGPSAGGRSPGA